MNYMEVLHRQERRDAHAVSDLQRNQAVGEPLLALKLWRDQRAAGERLGNTLRTLVNTQENTDAVAGAVVVVETLAPQELPRLRTSSR